MKTEEGPWIPLPSKQYPKEIYYFNVSTGESSWEKPESYSEPVDESTNLQCLARPSTPERTKTCSYIVESLSPATSPRKRGNARKPASEEHEKKCHKNEDEGILQRKKSKIIDNTLKTDVNIRIIMTDNNTGKAKYDERKLKNETHSLVMKHPKQFVKNSPYISSVKKLQNADSVFYDTHKGQQSYNDQYSRNIIPKKVADNNNYMTSRKPNCDRSNEQLPSTRSSFFDSHIYGSASLRLERLKKNLAEEQARKQQSYSDWPENSREKNWKMQLLNPRNSVAGESRFSGMHSRAPSCPRTNYLTDSGSGILRPDNDLTPIPHSSDLLAMRSRQSSYPLERDKSFFVRDYGHTKYSDDNTICKKKYELVPTNYSDNGSLQSSFLLNQQCSKLGGREHSHLPELGKKVVSRVQSPGILFKTFDNNSLRKYSFSENQDRPSVIKKDNYYLPWSETKFSLKPEISLSRENVGQSAKYHQFSLNDTLDKTKTVEGRFRLDPSKSSLKYTEFQCVSKTPAMDQMRSYKHSLYLTNIQRNELCGNDVPLNDKPNNIGSIKDRVQYTGFGNSSLTDPKLTQVLKTPSTDQLRDYKQKLFEVNIQRKPFCRNYFPLDDLLKNKVDDRVLDLECERYSTSDRKFPFISKPPSTNHLRDFKHTILQANIQRSQHHGNNCLSPNLTYSNIGSFASSSNTFPIGKPLGENSSRSLGTVRANETVRKPVESLSYNAMASGYSKSSRMQSEGLETKSKLYKTTEKNRSSLDWNSRGVIRDYNHKRINDIAQQHTVKLAEHLLNLTKRRSPEDTHIKIETVKQCRREEKINSHEDTISTHSDRYFKFVQPVCYQEKSSNDDKKLCCSSSNISKKDPKLALGKNLEFQEQISKVKPQTNLEDNKKTNYEISHNNLYNCTDHTKKKSSPRKDLTSNVMTRHKSDSKGAVSKSYGRNLNQLKKKLMQLPIFGNQGNVKISTDVLDQNSKSEDSVVEEEAMDWEPIEPEKVVLHVEALRKEGGLQNSVNPQLVNLCNVDSEITSQWFVVLDTNVLLSHLSFLRDLRDIKDDELGMPTLVIPWIVLQELDNLKSTKRKSALQFHARQAINFLFNNLSAKHPRVRGQPKAEADNHPDLEPDDNILQCSLNLLKYSDKVLLLTNDHNLFNKAAVNGLECCSATKLVEELERRRKMSCKSSNSPSSIIETSYPQYDATIQTAKRCIGVVLEEVLRTEMVLVFDRKWSLVVARKPPWTLNDVLFCLMKHWISVFQHVLPSAAKEVIETIRVFINNEVYEDTLENVENFIKTCVSLMQMVSSVSYKQYTDNALKTLNELQQMLKKQVKSTSVPATNSFLVKEKISDDLSSISSTTQLGALHSVSNVRSEQCTHSASSTVVNSEISKRSCSGDSKTVGDDDCLSLFASSFSEDINNQFSDDGIQRGQELAHKYLNKIFENVAGYCGILCDMLGVKPLVPYQPPQPLPTVETIRQNMLSIVKCVGSLLRCMEGILSTHPSELQEVSPVLVNFYSTIKEYLPAWEEFGEALLPHHLLVYCTQNDTREQLERGRKQFQEFEEILKQAVNFFLQQIQANAPMPSF